MGFLNHQANKVRRTATVGIAEDNDWGSFSGLEVSVSNNNSSSSSTVRGLKTVEDVSKRETDAKPIKKPKDKAFQRAKNFLKRKTKKMKDAKPLLSPFHRNQGSSGASDDLSVYTNGALAIQASSSSSHEPFLVTLEHVADLILDLEKAVVVGAKRPLRALKMLLALSSRNADNSVFGVQSSIRETRMDMVRVDGGKLVPVLLSFLNRCMVQSKEHTLALLLLGNLSIPQENKKVSNMCIFSWKAAQ